MISAIILLPAARDPASAVRPDQLARTLSALVPAFIEGIITEVVVIGSMIDSAHKAVADHAGCDIVESGNGVESFGPALAQTVRPQVFVLKAPYVPEDGFIEEVGWLLRDNAGGTWVVRERQTRLFSRPPIVGVLAPRTLFAGGKRDDFPALKRIRPARLLTARARRVR